MYAIRSYYAGCDAVSNTGAVIIGLIAGTAVVFGIEFIDKVLKVDDPVGAVGVHGICGATGTILTGVFATDSYLNNIDKTRLEFVGVQALGVVSVTAWVVITMTLVFFAIKKTIGFRVSRYEEIVGLDIEEHGLVLSDVISSIDTSLIDESDSEKLKQLTQQTVPMEKAIEIETYSKPATQGVITSYSIHYTKLYD